MSGHSKWSTIKHKKGALDAKRGKIFTKLIREITVAARMGGGDPESNPSLRTAISAARAQNMPSENITRAIKKGTGELEGTTYEEITFEGYGPGGVAVMVEALTDNRNRTVAEVRHLFSKYNGNLGEQGCVSWMFEKKGLIYFSKDSVDEDTLMEAALEAGAEDMNDEGSLWEVVTKPGDLEKVRDALIAKGFKPESSEVTMVPQSTVKLTGKDAATMLKLMDALEELDDSQKVYANFDISEEEMEKLSA